MEKKIILFKNATWCCKSSDCRFVWAFSL